MTTSRLTPELRSKLMEVFAEYRDSSFKADEAHKTGRQEEVEEMDARCNVLWREMWELTKSLPKNQRRKVRGGFWWLNLDL